MNRENYSGTSGCDQFTTPIHVYLHQPDMEHGQAISGFLFNIRWNYDWHTDTASCYNVQDYKRSSSWNIEHGYVETYTINQMSIASRSFLVVYQCHFEVFSTYSQSVRAKKNYSVFYQQTENNQNIRKYQKPKAR